MCGRGIRFCRKEKEEKDGDECNVSPVERKERRERRRDGRRVQHPCVVDRKRP